MPDLDFKILGVEAANYGIAPLLHFKLEVTNQPADEVIQSVMLQAQIQIHPTQRAYQPEEKGKIRRTLRNARSLGSNVARPSCGRTPT